jgi:hypothetical protein
VVFFCSSFLFSKRKEDALKAPSAFSFAYFSFLLKRKVGFFAGKVKNRQKGMLV